jgi:hypothetical protein
VSHKRTHVVIPEDLEVLRQEVNRRRLLQFLSDPEPLWKDEDHPELKDGAEAFVRRMRDEDLRLEQERLGDRSKL